MSYSQATALLEAIGASKHGDNVQVALDIIDKYGSYRNAMIEASHIDYKKKDELLFSLLGDEELDYTEDVKRISALMHTINRTITIEAEKTGSDYVKLLSSINIKATFKPIDMDIFVMNDIGGRKLISKVNRYEPNQLSRMIEKSVVKYNNRIDVDESFQIESKRVSALLGKLT